MDFSSITDDQLRSFQKAFQRYDKDKDDLIDTEEVKKALRALGIVPTDEEFEAMQYDLHEKVDVSSFIAVVYYFLRGADSQEELIRAFAVFDNDHDGKIPVDTAIQILTNLKHPVPRDMVDQIMAELNTNGDDLIDYSEMIRKLRPK